MPSTNQMSETKPAWTPGPWKQSGVNPHRIIAAEGRSVGLDICTAKAFRPGYREQSLANARLIAAAPDMRDCCGSFSVKEADGIVSLRISGLTICKHYADTPEGQALIYLGNLRRAAIAKAECR
jgi:hypothetical protein